MEKQLLNNRVFGRHAQAEMETPDFMVQLRAQLETSASESGSGSNSTSQGANSSDIRCVRITDGMPLGELQGS
jgi:hypothetical protein